MNPINSFVVLSTVFLAFTSFATFPSEAAPSAPAYCCPKFNVTVAAVQTCVTQIKAQPNIAAPLIADGFEDFNLGDDVTRNTTSICIIKAVNIQPTNQSDVCKAKSAPPSALKACLAQIITAVFSDPAHTTETFVCLGYTEQSAEAQTACLPLLTPADAAPSK